MELALRRQAVGVRANIQDLAVLDDHIADRAGDDDVRQVAAGQTPLRNGSIGEPTTSKARAAPAIHPASAAVIGEEDARAVPVTARRPWLSDPAGYSAARQPAVAAAASAVDAGTSRATRA